MLSHFVDHRSKSLQPQRHGVDAWKQNLNFTIFTDVLRQRRRRLGDFDSVFNLDPEGVRHPSRHRREKVFVHEPRPVLRAPERTPVRHLSERLHNQRRHQTPQHIHLILPLARRHLRHAHWNLCLFNFLVARRRPTHHLRRLRVLPRRHAHVRLARHPQHVHIAPCLALVRRRVSERRSQRSQLRAHRRFHHPPQRLPRARLRHLRLHAHRHQRHARER